MTYTVWQGDCLIGETDLAYEPVRPRHRGGNFFPSPGNEALIPTADLSLQLRDSTGRVIPTEWVAVYDLDASAIERDEVELDDLGFDEPLDEELEGAVEHDALFAREWKADAEFDEADDGPLGEEFSRYQIQLMLTEGTAIP